jgi:hypothetical protein
LEGLDLDMVQAEELFQLNSVDATGMREWPSVLGCREKKDLKTALKQHIKSIFL